MTTSPQNALTNAQSHLMDNARRTDSDGTVTASPLTQPEAFAQALASITSHSQSFGSALRRDPNARQPGINQLPTELLVAIFQSCLDTRNDDHVRRDATQLHRIRAVCRRWRTVAEGNPVLWRYVSAVDPPEHVKKALELSQPMSIAVVYTNLYRRVSEEEFRAAVNPHAARWHEAFMVYDDLDKADLQVWESSKLSELHTLEVISYSPEYTRHPILLNRGHELPDLQEARFLNVPLWLNPGQLPRLRVLELTACEGPDDGFTVPKLLNFLKGTPQLQRLGLLNMYSIVADVAFQGSIAFPSLTCLEIKGVDPDAMQQLFSTIHLPQCERDQNEVSEEVPTNPNIIPFHECNFDALEVRDDGINLWLGDFRLLTSTGFEWSVLEYMEVVLDGFAKEPASFKHIHAAIELTERPEAPAILSILNRLDQFPSLRSLELVLSPGNAPLLTLIQLLGRPNVLSDRIVWYLPHLEFLLVRVENTPFLELGQVCWERRRAAEISKCPKEIRELHISPLDESLEEEFKSQVDYKIQQELDKLQSKLGRGQLFWGSEPWRRLVNGDGPESTS